MKNGDPWMESWRPLMDRATLAQRLAAAPPPLTALDQMPAGLAAKALDDALDAVFHADEQILDLAEVLVTAAVHHLQLRYRGAEEYAGRVNAKMLNQVLNFIPPIPVTGHAGVGKSAIFKAIRRALATPQPVTIGGVSVCPEPIKLVPVGIAKSQLAVMRRVGGLGKTLEDCVPSAQRILYRDGVALLSFGEMQFVNQSGRANTLVAGILLQAGNLGVPAAYDANFSLMRRLRRRPPEERDRLLCNPIVMFPDVPGSKDAAALTTALIAVAPDVFQIDVKRNGIDLDKRTGGLKRMKRRLLVLAYLMKREQSRHDAVCVTIEDVRAAYKSGAFQDSRLIIEELGRRQDRTRRYEDDLSCPFDEPLSSSQARAVAARNFRNEQLAESELESAMTANEKRLVVDRESRREKKPTAAATVLNRGASKRVKGADRAANSAALAAEFS